MKPIRQKQFLSSVTEPRRELLTVVRGVMLHFPHVMLQESRSKTASLQGTFTLNDNETCTCQTNTGRLLKTSPELNMPLWFKERRQHVICMKMTGDQILQRRCKTLYQCWFFFLSLHRIFQNLSLCCLIVAVVKNASQQHSTTGDSTVDAFLDADLTTLSSYWLIISICWDGQQELLPSFLCHSLLLFESRLFSTLHR